MVTHGETPAQGFGEGVNPLGGQVGAGMDFGTQAAGGVGGTPGINMVAEQERVTEMVKAQMEEAVKGYVCEGEGGDQDGDGQREGSKGGEETG